MQHEKVYLVEFETLSGEGKKTSGRSYFLRPESVGELLRKHEDVRAMIYTVNRKSIHDYLIDDRCD
jgi:hypothetical protein